MKAVLNLTFKPALLACLCSVFLFGCPPGGGATIVFVNVNTPAGPGAQDGASWATAFAEIQDGVDAADAVGGGEVWVARGVYDEPRPNDPDGSLVMLSGVDLYGGFLGVEATRNARNYDHNETVIDGANGLATKAVILPNAYHVVKGANNATLDGFSITGGNSFNGVEDDEVVGGGMYNLSVSPTVKNCWFYLNNALSGGGAMYNEDADPEIWNCRFDNNNAPAIGGAIYNVDSAPFIARCLFLKNVVSAFGGAVGNFEGSAPVFKDCEFLYNHVSAQGGAVFNSTSDVRFINCIFGFNTATAVAGAMSNAESSVAIKNCTFYRNFTVAAAGAISDDGFDTTIINSIFWDNEAIGASSDIVGTVDITHSCTQTGIIGTGNISEDPLMVDPLNLDFRLKTDSPCKDTGTNVGAPAKDIRGVARPQGGGVDMGAFERSLALDGI